MYSVVRYTYTQRYLAYYLAGTSDDMDWVFENSVLLFQLLVINQKKIFLEYNLGFLPMVATFICELRYSAARFF